MEHPPKNSIKARDQEEYDFLDKILHMPFFEFCLLVKERKQLLKERLTK